MSNDLKDKTPTVYLIDYDEDINSELVPSDMGLHCDSSSKFFTNNDSKENQIKDDDNDIHVYLENCANESDQPTSNTLDINQSGDNEAPQHNESISLNNEASFISNVRPVTLKFDYEIFKKPLFEVKSTKTNEFSQKGNRRDYSKRDRGDYDLLKVKTRVSKFIKNTLNYYGKSCELTFYGPNAKLFTKNINYDDNKRWLSWTIKEIISVYDFKGTKNKDTLSKMENCKSSFSLLAVKSFLKLTFEECIELYANSIYFRYDLSKLDKESRKKFEELLKGNDENTFIYRMKHFKGNKKKKTK